MRRVLMTDYAWSDLDIERQTLAAAGAELIVAPAKDEATLVAAAVGAEAIMTNWAQVTAPVIEAAPQLKIVARMGIGLDNIDLACATRHKIPVTNVPDYCVTEVAEHSLAMLLSLARKVAFFHHATKQGVYDLSAGPRLARIEGQTLGIVGLGNIGRCLAGKALGLGLKVLATSRNPRDVPAGVKIVSLDELLAQSDYVSLHVPLVPQTKHLIGRRELALFKPTAYLINTARGGLIDQPALAAALAAGQLAGAGLDVQVPEPPDLSVAPWNDPRVVVTPHAAFTSLESIIYLRQRVSQQVAEALKGKRPANVVNPEVLD